MNLFDKLLGIDDADLVNVKTMFGRTKVYDVRDGDGRIVRVLEVNGTWQSAAYADHSHDDLAFPYHRIFDRALNAPGEVTRALMLGGGALAYPKHLVTHLPEVRVDVVEIDPQVIGLAKEWFFFDRLTADEQARIHITCGDAVSFLRDAVERGERYDLVANDLFAAKKPTAALMSADGLSLVKRSLTDEGIYVANVISALTGYRAKPLRTVQGALERVFSQVEVIAPGRDQPRMPDNNVVFATNASFSLADALAVEGPLGA